MDIQQIAIFLTLIDTKSFTETAEQLYMSQPSASKQIKALEEELRVHLFRRRGKSVELTETEHLMQQVTNLQCRLTM